MELVDSSVWIQQRNPALRPWFESRLGLGMIAMCDIIALELLMGESSSERYRQRSVALSTLTWIPPDGRDWIRARRVHAELAERGGQRHRRVKIADLIIAATAERSGMELVHYDQDFDLIQSVTGQPMRWAAQRGSL